MFGEKWREKTVKEKNVGQEDGWEKRTNVSEKEKNGNERQ